MFRAFSLVYQVYIYQWIDHAEYFLVTVITQRLQNAYLHQVQVFWHITAHFWPCDHVPVEFPTDQKQPTQC